MTLDEALDHALTKPGARLDQPWEDRLVVKVADKIFLFTGDQGLGVKCGSTRQDGEELGAAFPQDVAPMPYLAHRGWIQVQLDGAVGDEQLRSLIDASYALVVRGLPKGRRPV